MFSSRVTKNSIRRGLTRLAALLFVVYALADVTVLQAYCGNEAIGIPPAHYLSKNTVVENSGIAVSRPSKYLTSMGRKLDGPYRQGGDPSQNRDDASCFCCCSHAIAGSFTILSYISTNIRPRPSQSDSYIGRYSNSSLTQLFRPPKSA